MSKRHSTFSFRYFEQWLPGILLAVPLLIVGVVAGKALSLELESKDVNSIQQRQAALQRYQAVAVQALTLSAQQTVRTIRASLDKYTLRNTRNMAASDSLLFYFIKQHGERLFPPTESTSILVPEQFFLEILQRDIASALSQLQVSDSSFKQVTLPHYKNSTTFYCEKDDLGTEVCVLMSFDSVVKTISTSLKNMSDTEGVPNVSLSPPLSNNGELEAHYLAQYLSPPLHHFTVYVDSSFNLSALSAYTIYLIIGLPLLACWSLVITIFYKNQRQKINEAKSRNQLAAHLAHDLRTPLANLKLYAELLSRKKDKPESIERYAHIIMHELSSLDRLSERTIQTAYGGSSRQTLDRLIPLSFVQNCVAQKSPFIGSSDCEVNLSGTAKHPIYTDALTFESILTQLIDNAIKHAATKRIDIVVDLKRNEINLQVRDFGLGIRVKDQQNIFNQGFRASRNNTPGYGLGLSGVMHLARLNGGDIIYTNMSPGSMFLVKLPIEHRV